MSHSKSLRAAMLVFGGSVFYSLSFCAIARDGDPDRSFGTLGSTSLTFPGGLFIEQSYPDVKVLANGKLLVSATVKTGTSAATDMGVMRLNPNGSIDTTFGVSGARVVGFDRAGSDNFDYTRAMAVQPDGRILLFGEAAGGTGGIDMAVVRLNADGSIDTGFGVGGKTTVAFDLGNTAAARADSGVRIGLQGDGKILLNGNAATSAGSVMAIARLTSAGILDISFDSDGKRILDFGGGLADQAIGFTIMTAADGLHAYAIGVATLSGNADFAIARLNNNGSMDSTFAGDGTTTFGFDIGGDLGDVATDIIELSDGKLLACGHAAAVPGSSFGGFDMACVRVLAGGTVDTSYLPTLIPFNLNAEGSDLAFVARMDAKERILLAGRASSGPPLSADMAVARLLPSGQVDPSFGIDGRMVYDGPVSNAFNQGFGMALQPDGKIVVAGPARDSLSRDLVQIVRLIGDTLFETGF